LKNVFQFYLWFYLQQHLQLVEDWGRAGADADMDDGRDGEHRRRRRSSDGGAAGCCDTSPTMSGVT